MTKAPKVCAEGPVRGHGKLPIHGHEIPH
jgi:hypothetical protein